MLFNPPFTCSTSPVMQLAPLLRRSAITEAIAMGKAASYWARIGLVSQSLR